MGPPIERFLVRVLVSLGVVSTTASCSDSSEQLEGLGTEFDIAALSEPVLRLCSESGCSDYSQSECEFYLRFDSLMYARLGQDPKRCFDELVGHISCLADARSCDEPTCAYPEAACELSSEAPAINVPPAVAPTEVACALRADCEEEFGEREWIIADCEAEYVARSEIHQYDQGPACAQRFIDMIACFGNAPIPCDADALDEEEACPGEVAAYLQTCFP